jgi:hypothetical protein
MSYFNINFQNMSSHAIAPFLKGKMKAEKYVQVFQQYMSSKTYIL